MIIPPFYSIEVFEPNGTVVETIDNPVSLVAARSYSQAGAATLTLLPQWEEDFFRFNMRFKLWRTDAVHGKALFGDTVWFLRKFVNQVSERKYVVELQDSLSILANPLVAYTAETMYADKTLESFDLITYTDDFRIDNMMRQYVRENLGVDAEDAARINPYIRVEQDLNLAPFGEKTAAWAKLNDVLNDLARMSGEKGIELFYDLLPQEDATLLFKVWKGVRSNDRGFGSANSVIFTDQDDDLDEIQVTYDYSNMGTYCYVLGYDSGPSQVVQEVGNADIIRSDPFGRVEFTHNSAENDAASVLTADGQAALRGRRPRRLLSARLSPASSVRYGTDFVYGDRVGVQVGGRLYDAQISAVRAEWQLGRERLEIRLDGSESLWNPTYWEGDDRTPVPIVTPEISYDVPEEPPTEYVPPDFGDPSIFFGEVQAYIAWDGIRVFRTWNLQDASPLWHVMSDGITGDIYDCQYVNTDATTIGAWLMTSTGIFWCADVMADTPAWVMKLDITTVRAAEEALATGVINFLTMAHVWAQPGHLCVATGPSVHSQLNLDYTHAYFWVTEDFGDTWTHVDMNYFTSTSGVHVRGYSSAWLYSMVAFRSEPIIWCVRMTPPDGLGVALSIFRSDDGGLTWTQRADAALGGIGSQLFTSLHHPFPSITDPAYMTRGPIGVSLRQNLYRSEDGFETIGSALLSNGVNPSGYGGISLGGRINKRTFDNDHVIAWMRHTATDNAHLMQSLDRGATWSMLWDSDLAEPNVSGTPVGTVSMAPYNTPNGWPPDVDQWVAVREAPGSGITNWVVLTLDNFATQLDKTGNLPSLVSGWDTGPNNGFALPRMGDNGGDPPDFDSHILLRVARDAGTASNTTLSISSTGVVEGDLVLLHLSTVVDAAPTVVPAGFTLLPNGEITGGPTIRVYQKIATGSEPANYTFNFGSSIRIGLGLMALYADIAGTVTLDADAKDTVSNSANIFPSVTTTVANTFLTAMSSFGASTTVTARGGMVIQYPASGGRYVGMTQTPISSVGPTGTRAVSGAITGMSNVHGVTAAWKVV